jgi:hypothetical protein
MPASACAFLLLRHDFGHLAAIIGGLTAGIATLLLGQCLIAFIRSPLLRAVNRAPLCHSGSHRRLSSRTCPWIAGNGQQHAAGSFRDQSLPWRHPSRHGEA